MEANVEDEVFLEDKVIKYMDLNASLARKKARKLLESKFFPNDLRIKLWRGLIKNPCQLDKKWYESYKKLVQKEGEFGSYPLIQSTVQKSLSEWQIDQNPKFKESIITMMLVFEMSQPDIGYVPGMEKLAIFLRKMMEEDSAFIIFFNIIFSSNFLWSIYEQNQERICQYLQLFGRFICYESSYENSFQTNKFIYQKFLVEEASTLFLNIIDTSLTE